jgi:HD-GYP domain-containing protein (c-di-GMP phosphodiesterase class II)/anti-sigma regulatory factor (Ser/Thr protein kinase)
MSSTQQRLRLRNQTSELARLTGFATEFCDRHRLPDAERGHLLVILDELFTNVVTYGYEAGANGQIDVVLMLRNDRLSVQFVDDGRAFDPLAIATPAEELPLEERLVSGLGLAIVRGLADEISYHREGDRNRLTLARDVASSRDLTNESVLLGLPEAPTAADFIDQDPDIAYRWLIEVGVALSAERDHNRLLEKIVVGAKELTNADGGTLYLVSEDGSELDFIIMRNDTMGFALGGTTGEAVPFAPVPLRDADGTPNRHSVVAAAAIAGETIILADVHNAPGFDFSVARAFDAKTGYRSQSFLSVPLKNHDAEVVGVLQLINARAPDGSTISFAAEFVPLIEALASQAAVALDNQMLIDAQKNLFRSVLKVFDAAIDAKSPYTGGHCHRVPEATNMLARAADAATEGPFAEFHLNGEEWYELEVAGGLHDCGKVTTHEYVVDKATKLETIYNRIHEIRTRFEVVKRDAEIDYLRALLAGGDEAVLRAARDARFAELDDDFAFVADCNIGSEFMAPEKIARLQRIASATWQRTIDDRLGLSWTESTRRPDSSVALPATEYLLADKSSHLIEHDTAPLAPDNRWGFVIKPPAYKANLGEVHNLSIRYGTLTAEERYHINDHIVQTIIMLEALPYPKNLRRVPEWAGGHHEKMDGTGYPRGLKREQMSIPARIMMIADIFEALTARDRPYKARKKLSECIDIMARMSRERHIDPDLFELFLKSGVYRAYAEIFLLPEQIDEVDVTRYSGVPNPPADAVPSPIAVQRIGPLDTSPMIHRPRSAARCLSLPNRESSTAPRRRAGNSRTATHSMAAESAWFDSTTNGAQRSRAIGHRRRSRPGT